MLFCFQITPVDGIIFVTHKPLVFLQTQIAKKMGDVSKNQTRTELKDELPEI